MAAVAHRHDFSASKDALELAPDNDELHAEFAELLLSAGKPRDAEKRLNDILATNPGMPEATRASSGRAAISAPAKESAPPSPPANCRAAASLIGRTGAAMTASSTR